MTSARTRGAALVAALATALPLLSTTPASAAAPVGVQLAYVLDADGDLAGALVVRDLSTRTVRTVLPEGEDYVVDPVLSPDGTRIAFATDRDSVDGGIGIAVVNVDGTGFRRLTDPPLPGPGGPEDVVDVSPTWQPLDGSIVFGRESYYGAETSAVLMSVPGRGGPAAQLHAWGAATDPVISADGRDIAATVLSPFASDASDFGVAVIRDYLTAPAGSSRLVRSQAAEPAFSPDGKDLAYELLDAEGIPTAIGSTRIAEPAVSYTSDPGTRVYGTPDDSAAVFAPAWLPDGRSLVFSRQDLTSDTASADLWAADRSGLRAGPLVATGAEEVFGTTGPRQDAPVSAGSASTYVPVTPVRVLDTRSGHRGSLPRQAPAPVPAGGTVAVQVTGQATSLGPVPATATAVILNVTVTGVSASTDVRAYPSGSAVPDVSNINAGKGQTVPNLVTVPLGRDGAVVLRNSAGSVALLADLAGYYVPGDGGHAYTPLRPVRWLDTRPGSGVEGERRGPVQGGEYLPLTLIGNRDVGQGAPDTATAVILNVTAVGATRPTDVRIYPSELGSSAVPEVSNLNVRPGEAVANLVVVPLGETGFVRLRNAVGSVHLLVDILGWYGPGGSSQFVPVQPARFLDTRDGTGSAPLAVTAGRFADVAVAGWRGVPSEATAAVLNLTATAVTASTDIRAYPAANQASDVPLVSNLNTTAGRTRANAAVVGVGPLPHVDGAVRIRNASGSAHLIADLAGYFVPAS